MRIIKFEKILDILIKFSYLAVVFLIPVYFSLILVGNNIFELNKIISFKVLIWLLFLLTAIKIVGYEYNRQYFKKVFLNKWLLGPILFIVMLVVISLLAQDPETSFFGLYSRQQGLISYLFYFVFLLLLIFNISRFREIKSIIITIGLSSFVVSLYGLAQISGWDFINWNEPAYLTGRVTSTLGQPNFLASYLLLALPLIVYLIVHSKKILIKFSWLIVLIFGLLNLFFTYSRAGWLGLFLGIIITAIIYWLVVGKKVNRKYLKLSGLVLVIASLFIVIIFLKNDFLQTRLKTAINIKTGSVAARLNFYKASGKTIGNKPWLGYGLDTQGEIFARAYEKDWAIYGDVNVYPNRAHNLILDILLTSGILGLISYLALLYVFVKLIISNLKKNKNRLLSAMILLAIISYLISLMFGFTIVVTNVYFWLYLAILWKLSFKVDKSKIEKQSLDWKYISFLLFIIMFIALAVFYQIKQEAKYLVTDYYFQEFKKARNQEQYFDALSMYDLIKEQKIRDNYYQKQIGLILSDWLLQIKEPIYKRLGENILQEILLNIEKNNYKDIFIRGKIYNALGDYDLAQDNFKTVIALSPEIPRNYLELAKVYLAQDNFNLAQDNFNLALSFLPDTENICMNDNHRAVINYEKYLIFKDLAEIYVKQRDFKKGENYWNLAYQHYQDTSIFKKIADLYYLQDDLDKAIWYNKRGYVRNPQDYAWPFAIALLYDEVENKAKALDYAQEALELVPDNKNVINFINKLK